MDLSWISLACKINRINRNKNKINGINRNKNRRKFVLQEEPKSECSKDTIGSNSRN